MKEQIDLPGSAYLYALAAMFVTFVGFSALVMIFRQTFGAKMTRYFFTIAFVQTGFIVTAGSLLPPLLALYEFPPDIVWRWSNVISAIVVFLFSGHFSVMARGLDRNVIKAAATLLLAASPTNLRDHSLSLLRDASCRGVDRG